MLEVTDLVLNSLEFFVVHHQVLGFDHGDVDFGHFSGEIGVATKFKQALRLAEVGEILALVEPSILAQDRRRPHAHPALAHALILRLHGGRVFLGYRLEALVGMLLDLLDGRLHHRVEPSLVKRIVDGLLGAEYLG